MNKKIFFIFLIFFIFSFFPYQKILAEGKINIVINEFIPNPEGADKENEWIEIKNLENREVDLNGWKLKDNSEKEYIIKEKISPLGYLIFPRQETKITINNKDETIFLLTPDNKISSKIGFIGNSKEGYSFSRKGKNDWQWTSITTPEKENVFEEDIDNKKGNTEKNTEKNTGENTGENTEKNTGEKKKENTKEKTREKEIQEKKLDNNLANLSNNKETFGNSNMKIIGLVILIGIIFSFLSALFVRKYLK
jgi:hypothetical protein